jgi:hypothetical protein
MGTRGYRCWPLFSPLEVGYSFIPKFSQSLSTQRIQPLRQLSFQLARITRHFLSYTHAPSQDLGIKVATEIPHDAEAYKLWIEKLREALDHHFEQKKDEIDSPNGLNYRITTERPLNDLWIEWVYEIDLDHEVFLGKSLFSSSSKHDWISHFEAVDSRPLFALNNMPDSEALFIQCIGFDSYGHRGYDPSTPEKHVYNWQSAPPKVDDHVLDDYNAHQPKAEPFASISELLGATGRKMSSCEAVRIALYEVIIGKVMSSWEIGRAVRVLETAADRADIPVFLLAAGVDMVQVTLGRMLFGLKVKTAPADPKGSEFSWLAPDICMRITTHLDNERNMKKSTLELVDEVAANRQPGSVTYGILFSFFHCVIVRVDSQNEFKSTAALQFLPSFYATSSSTPGIMAIGSLAYHCLDTVNVDGALNTIPPDHFLHQVPLDVLENIAALLGPSELETLSTAATIFQPATENTSLRAHWRCASRRKYPVVAQGVGGGADGRGCG